MTNPVHTPVFLDPAGRRWRRWRLGLVLLGVVSTVLVLAVVIGVLVIPPSAPDIPINETTPPPPAVLRGGARAERERNLIRRRFLALAGRPYLPPGRRPQYIPPATGTASSAAPGTRGVRQGRPIIAGFYVTGEDNTRSSLTAHIRDLDWIVCEWSYVDPNGTTLDFFPDNRVFTIVRQIEDETARPGIFLMVSNYDSLQSRFNPVSLRTLVSSPANRARAVQQLVQEVQKLNLAGVTVDFEDVPRDLEDAVVGFTHDVRVAMQHINRRVTVAVRAGEDPALLRRTADEADYVFPMIFDEHFQGGDPGPIASQAFYERFARQVVAIVPPAKVVLMIGAYGYDWNDAGPKDSASTMTFQETMRVLRDSGAVFRFDSVSLNPYAEYMSPDSTDHIIWFLDGVTAYNQVRVGEQLGVAGYGMWRLGQEDQTVWPIFRSVRAGEPPARDSLRILHPGYEVEFDHPGAVAGGEILRVERTPTTGIREFHLGPGSMVARESVSAVPTPWAVRAYGARKHRIALTFDDGPDGRWTPMILDTLKKYHAPATFFIIGENAQTHIGLTQRIYDEGHEIGNHTYRHPNMALVSDREARYQIDENARVIEAIVDHRTAFWRPPYFGDATPSTPEELHPVNIANERGYYTIGLKIDSEDWQAGVSVDSILGLVLDVPEDSGNVVLLHDGGGDRSRTVAALGPLIDSLRARGDTLVLVSALAGLTRDQVMPHLARREELPRLLDLMAFASLGKLQQGMYWVFLAAVWLGIARLLFVGALALAQRLTRHQRRGGPTPFHPPVSVIIPAYNEGKVVVGTIASLMRQEYPAPIEIVVVDDGSTDQTLAVTREAYGDDPQVTILTKPNGGKASALNHGLAHCAHDVIIGLDADTIFAPDTVAELVQPLADPRVGAVAGNAKVGNRINIVTRWQALEYVTSQNFDRRAFSLLNGITVVPGAVGAWRRRIVQEVGGFTHDTLAEDQDLTLAVRRAGYTIAYADGAVAYTEAPDTLRTLAKQRFRWSFGTLQCAWKHRDTLFRPRYGTLGFIALPNTWLFQLLLPAISPVADLMFVFSFWTVRKNFAQHGSTYGWASLQHVLTYYALFLLVDWLAAMVGFLMEPHEEKKLTWLIFIQRFAYRQVMYWVVVRAFKAALTGRLHGWGKLERKATVALPEGARA